LSNTKIDFKNNGPCIVLFNASVTAIKQTLYNL